MTIGELLENLIIQLIEILVPLSAIIISIIALAQSKATQEDIDKLKYQNDKLETKWKNILEIIYANITSLNEKIEIQKITKKKKKSSEEKA